MENRGNRLSGVLGFSYGNFKNRDNSLINIDPCVAFPIPCFGMIPFQDTLTQNQTKSLAGYADLRYRFLDRWVLITGGRALRDEVSTDASGFQFAGVDMFGSPIYNVLNNSTNETFKAFVPKLGVTYDLTTTQTIGFTYSQGYRAGFGQVVGGAISRVSPEFLDAYEVSYRSLWLDDTLGFNTNVFYYDYSNQQVAVPDPIIPAFNRIVNGGKSHSYGAEFELYLKLLIAFHSTRRSGCFSLASTSSLPPPGISAGTNFLRRRAIRSMLAACTKIRKVGLWARMPVSSMGSTATPMSPMIRFAMSAARRSSMPARVGSTRTPS